MVPLRCLGLLLLVLGCQQPVPPAPPQVEPPAVQEPEPTPPPAPEPTAERAPEPEPAPAIDPSWKTHTDRRSKISFRYPSDYLLRQTRTRADESAVILMQDDKFARAYANGKLKGKPTDGPMQISIWLRKVELKDQTLEAFVQEDIKKAQNEAALETVEVAGQKAFAYKTDGLWQGRTVVIERPGLLVQAHVDFNAPEDRLRKDFDAIVGSLSW